MKTREIIIGGKKIEIFDDAFTAKEKVRMYRRAYQAPYHIDRMNLDVPESEQYAKTLKHSLSLREILDYEFFKNETVLKLIEDNNQRLERVYINLGTASDIYTYHTDSGSNNSKSMLYYMNFQWEPTWEGETHFSDDAMVDILASCSYIPGRLVVFDNCLPHKSSQPSFEAKFYRMILVVKLRGTDEPGWKNSLRIQDLIFDLYDKEKLTENEKKAFDFISGEAEEVKNHAYSVFSLLKKFNQTEEVCIAGLLSRISDIETQNDSLKELIFNFRKFRPLEDTNKDVDTLKFLYMRYANLISTLYKAEVDENILIQIRNKIDLIEQQQ